VAETKKSGFCSFFLFSACARCRFTLSSSDMAEELISGERRRTEWSGIERNRKLEE
jgi:hypothetical protein